MPDVHRNDCFIIACRIQVWNAWMSGSASRSGKWEQILARE
jgi:hypothetical protein